MGRDRDSSGLYPAGEKGAEDVTTAPSDGAIWDPTVSRAQVEADKAPV